MQRLGVITTGEILDLLIVASVGTGKARKSVKLSKVSVRDGNNIRLVIQELKHLLKAHAELPNPTFWNETKTIMTENTDVLSLPELKPTVNSLVMTFACCRRKLICD